MATNAVLVKVDGEAVVQALQKAAEELKGAEGEMVLDFSSVRRIDASALRALEDLARTADEKKIKLVLRGVSVDVYKVMKLGKLAGRFGFLN